MDGKEVETEEPSLSRSFVEKSREIELEMDMESRNGCLF